MITLVARCDDHVYVIHCTPNDFLYHTHDTERAHKFLLEVARVKSADENKDLVCGLIALITIRRAQLLNNPS